MDDYMRDIVKDPDELMRTIHGVLKHAGWDGTGYTYLALDLIAALEEMGFGVSYAWYSEKDRLAFEENMRLGTPSDRSTWWSDE